ncbi:exopolysaccharide biosynthesis protein [Clostridium novyi A str. 4552]|uniref:Exopolysaccharide biosynthesis protein n=1 Tax=Clostridium novyi A str. 4552 TaxID=1444289 RepID=A0A0A0IFW2_CLONO|nr:phosphodiester glycosidase family protein [Clostridium novyi]KGM98470.1 exopolysaccharide biosynthesis protein [Clostridium novyi A str. 4552]
MFNKESIREKLPKRLFLLFEIVFTLISAPFLLYYGPFENVKATVVGSAMTTSTHQWIATTFLSRKHIDEILSKNKINTLVQSDIDELRKKINSGEISDTNEIEKREIHGDKFTGHLLVIKNPKKIRVGHNEHLGSKGETTSAMAKRYNSIAAINAGGFVANHDSKEETNPSESNGNPGGILISNGEIVYNNLRNGEKICIAGITADGILLVGNYNLDEMMKLNVKDAVSFGPALIVNGQKTITSGDGGWGTAPRTAIGQRKDGSILFLVIDGKYIGRLAVTLRELQDILYEYGAYNAVNLDGGSSSTMYYNGKVISEPYKSTGEREIQSIFYVSP